MELNWFVVMAASWVSFVIGLIVGVEVTERDEAKKRDEKFNQP